jgi:hypothetical protein
LRDKHLKARLESDKHPQAKLIKATGESGKGKALIELKGMQKEVAGTYAIEGKDLKAQFKIHLPDWDIKDISYAGLGVEDDVVVDVVVPLQEKGGPAALPATAPAKPGTAPAKAVGSPAKVPAKAAPPGKKLKK